jgi:hypothetical protein
MHKVTYFSLTSCGTTAVNTAIPHLIDVNLRLEKRSLSVSLVNEFSFSTGPIISLIVSKKLQNVMGNSEHYHLPEWLADVTKLVNTANARASAMAD